MDEETLNPKLRTERGFTRLCAIRCHCDIPHALGEQGRSTLRISRRDPLFVLFNRLGPTPPRRILTPYAVQNGHITSKLRLL